MLTRPGREPESGRCRARVGGGHAVVDEAGRTAEDQEVAAAQLEVGERGGPAVDPGEAEPAGVAEADGDDRRVDGLVAVLVQPEAGAGRVEVDDRRVGGEGGDRGVVLAVGRGDGAAGQLDELGRERLDRRAVGVVGRGRVAVGLPVPAQADRLERHEVTGGHPRVAEAGRRFGPPAEVVGQRPLLRRGPASPRPARRRAAPRRCDRGRSAGRPTARAGPRAAQPAVAASSAPRDGSSSAPSAAASRAAGGRTGRWWSRRVDPDRVGIGCASPRGGAPAGSRCGARRHWWRG